MHSTYKKVSGMTAEIKIRRCYGCGAVLQSQDKFEPGYVSKKRADKDEGLCDRCFDLRHSSLDPNQTLDSDFAEFLKKAKENGALFCYVFDSFALDASFVPGLNEFLGSNILAIFTKRDILPTSWKNDDIIESFRSQLKMNGIEPLDIILTSAYQSFDFDAFMEKIEKYRKGKDVYFLGANQVGKSSLINNFLMKYDNETGRNITSEKIGNEGMVLTAIPLDKDSTLFDTPGIFNPKSILNQVERRTLKYIVPHVAVSSVYDELDKGNSIFLGALARIDNIGEEDLSLKFYFARDVIRTSSKIGDADLKFTSLCASGDGKPASATVKSIADLEKHTFKIPDDTNALVSIYGYGKIVIQKGKGQAVDVYAPKGVGVDCYSDSAWLKISE